MEYQMKKLLLVTLSFLFVQQAYGLSLEQELETLAKSLTKLAQDLGGGEETPPPPPRDEVVWLANFKTRLHYTKEDLEELQKNLGEVETKKLVAPEELEEYRKLPLQSQILMPSQPSSLSDTGPKPPAVLPPPPSSGLGTTIKPSVNEQELLERLSRYSKDIFHDFYRLMSNLTEAKNLKTISADQIRPYEILLFEQIPDRIYVDLLESDWRELHWLLDLLLNYDAHPDVVATSKSKIEEMLNRRFESLLAENDETGYVDLIKAINGLVSPGIIVEARNKLFEAIKPKLKEQLEEREWNSLSLKNYLGYLDDLKKAGVPEDNLTYYKEQVGIKALSTLEKISKTTEWDEYNIDFFYDCFKVLKDFGMLPKEGSTYQEQLRSLLIPELAKEFSQVTTWDYKSIGKISHLVNMLIEVGASPLQLKKYQDTLLLNIRSQLDKILNEKDIGQLTDQSISWRPTRVYLKYLEESGASQADVRKYKDLYVKYIKNRLDALLSEANAAKGTLPQGKIRFANQLRDHLEELNILSKDEITSYRQQIADIRLP